MTSSTVTGDELGVDGGSTERWTTGPNLALIAVALGMFLLHTLLTDMSRPINWDEAVHFTQVVPGRPAVFMEPHRTRGLSFLVAPIGLFDPPMLWLRLYIAALAAAGTWAAFRTWIPLIGWGAPLAAALFSTYWVTFFYAIEILPNLPSALLTVATLGLAGRTVTDGTCDLRRALLLAASFAAFVLVRPPDAVLVGLAVGGLLLLQPSASRIRALLGAAVGGLAGLTTWFAEGAMRFGLRPWELVRSSGEYGVDGAAPTRFNLPIYIATLDDKLRCSSRCQELFLEEFGTWSLPDPPTTAFLVAAAAAGLTGLAAARRRAWPPVVSATVAGILLLAFYDRIGGALNHRYLLPAVASLLLPAALGLVRLATLGASRWRPLTVGLVLAAVGISSFWQVSKALHHLDVIGLREQSAEAAAQIAPHVDRDRPCAIGAVNFYPQIAYTTRCRATQVAPSGPQLQSPLGERGSYVDLAARAAAGDQVLVMVAEEDLSEAGLDRWVRIGTIEYGDGSHHVLLELPPGIEPPPPPCPAGEESRVLARVLSDGCA